MIYIFIFLLFFSCSHLRDNTAHHTLEQGLESFVQGDVEKSCSHFNLALDAIDYYSQNSAPEIAVKTLLQDDVSAYQPPPFEQALARIYYAFSLLKKGEEDNATAALLYMENHGVENPLATYLLAVLLQRRGDVSNSRILFSRLKLEPQAPNLLVVHHRGRAPYKISKIAPVSIVSMVLLEEILRAHKIKPALSSLAGVPIPELVEHPPAPPLAFQIKDSSLPLTLTYSIRDSAYEQLEKDMPMIAARSAARLLLRRAFVAKEKWADIPMFFANLVTEADTRSWTALPSCIEVSSAYIEPGDHIIEFNGQTLPFQVKEKELAILHIYQKDIL